MAATIVVAVSSLPSLADYANGAPDYNREPVTENAGSMVAATPYDLTLETQGDMGDSPDAINPLNRKRHDSPETPLYLIRNDNDPESPYITPGKVRTDKQIPRPRGRFNWEDNGSNVLKKTTTRLIAPVSDYINKAPFPSGTWTLGFPSQGAKPYLGVDASRTPESGPGGSLPQTSTSSVDINIVER